MATTKIEASNIASGAVPSTGFTSVQVFTAASTWTRPTDITKVKNTLGWSPRFTLDAAIIQTIEWYESNRNKSN